MKKIFSSIHIAVVLFSIALVTGCSNDDAEVRKSAGSPTLPADQLAYIHAEADRIASEEVKRIQQSADKRSPNGNDFIGLDVGNVVPTGVTSANYNFTSGVRSPSLLNPGMVPSYNYLFCAAPNHFRYVVLYFYNGYTNTATSINSIMGPTGGCLVGTTNFTVNIGGPNTSQTFVIIFDVLNGPGGTGPTQVAGPIWSNSRDLSYPNYHILNPGYYWF